MTKPMSFWHLVELRPSRAAVMAEWTSVGGDALAAVRPMLQPISRRATAYPDDRKPGRLLKVVGHADGSIVAIDEQDWRHRLALRPEDVVLYQLDLRKLRATLCSALSCVNVARTPVGQGARTLQVGNWEPKKAASFPVYLFMCRTSGLLRTEILDRIARFQKSGAITLTPTRTHWDDDLEALARARKLLLVAAEEIVEPDGDALRETASWEEYLQAFCQMVRLTLPSNYRNKKPAPMRGTRAANIEKLEKELEKHLLAARDHAHSLRDRDLDPVLLPRPLQKELAQRTGLTAPDVSRCLQDPRAKLLRILWDTAQSLDDVMRFKRPH
jgi:hypothetical protein